MPFNRKQLFSFIIYIVIGVTLGATIFVPIVEDTFIGISIGILLMLAIWPSTKKK